MAGNPRAPARPPMVELTVRAGIRPPQMEPVRRAHIIGASMHNGAIACRGSVRQVLTIFDEIANGRETVDPFELLERMDPEFANTCKYAMGWWGSSRVFRGNREQCGAQDGDDDSAGGPVECLYGPSSTDGSGGGDGLSADDGSGTACEAYSGACEPYGVAKGALSVMYGGQWNGLPFEGDAPYSVFDEE